MLGNSLTAIAPTIRVTYRARQDLRLPLFVSIDGQIPVLLISSLEAQRVYRKDGTSGITNKEQLAEHDLLFRAMAGFELLPFLQPYIGFQRSILDQIRTEQVDGLDDSAFHPDKDPKYHENILASYISVGIQGIVPLNYDADVRLRYDLGYKIPQSVFVNNSSSFFDPGIWGQGTTGSEYGGSLQVDFPLTLLELYNGYWTVGGTFMRRDWNGDGQTSTAFHSPHWPANSLTNAGGFIGLGLFF